MKISSFLPAFLLSLIAVCAAYGQSGGQAVSSKSAEYLQAKQKLFEIVQSKHQDTPFVLLTPDDLKILPSADLNILQSPQGTCDTALLIQSGQTVNGQLTSSDCLLDDGTYADIYAFNGNQGDQATIAMNSSAFDTYLALLNDDGTFDVEDDDGGGGTNSKIVAQLPASGLYIIFANSVLPATFGDYTLSLSVVNTCTFSLSPTAIDVPAAGGNYSYTINTQPGCPWNVTTYYAYSYISVPVRSGVGPGTFNFSVEANPFLSPRNGGFFTVQNQKLIVNQAAKVCTYSVSATSATVPAARSTGSVGVTTQDGCFWRAYSNSAVVTDNNGTYGSGVVNYIVPTNNGANRTLTFTVADATFTVYQTGLNCTFSVSPTKILVDKFENTGTIFVTTQPGCEWSVGRNNWILVDDKVAAGSGSFTYKIGNNQNSTVSRTNNLFVGQTGFAVNFTQTATSFRSRPDFNGDGKADFSVYRTSNNYWYSQQANGDFNGVSLGGANDKIVPADYDGDGKTDIAVYNGGNWTIIRSSTNQLYTVNFGAAEDIPVPADFDGDGKADISVYRPSNGVWYRLNSSNNQFVANSWGTMGDKPAIGDFDGDGKADLAVYRPSNGVWYIVNSTTGNYTIIGFGAAEDLITPGDYDGDGKTDIAVYRPSTNIWYRLNSSDGSFYAVSWGASGDKPVPTDYDGDGKTDVAVYRNGTWYIVRSSDGQIGFGYFGNDTDVPLPNVYVR